MWRTFNVTYVKCDVYQISRVFYVTYMQCDVHIMSRTSNVTWLNVTYIQRDVHSMWRTFNMMCIECNGYGDFADQNKFNQAALLPVIVVRPTSNVQSPWPRHQEWSSGTGKASTRREVFPLSSSQEFNEFPQSRHIRLSFLILDATGNVFYWFQKVQVTTPEQICGEEPRNHDHGLQPKYVHWPQPRWHLPLHCFYSLYICSSAAGARRGRCRHSLYICSSAAGDRRSCCRRSLCRRSASVRFNPRLGFSYKLLILCTSVRTDYVSNSNWIRVQHTNRFVYWTPVRWIWIQHCNAQTQNHHPCHDSRPRRPLV